MHFQCKKVECRSGSLHVGSVAMAIKNVRQHWWLSVSPNTTGPSPLAQLGLQNTNGRQWQELTEI
jgi:hypothetical protein